MDDARVTLRRLSIDESSWLDEWLGGVAASVGYDAIDPADPAASLLLRLRDEPSLKARIIERGTDDVGVVVYRICASRRRAGIFELVGVPATCARLGSGMMAAGCAEREMSGEGVRTIYAPAPAVHGIAVYFWIRLGYRPLQRAEWPCDLPGVLWMRRDIPR